MKYPSGRLWRFARTIEVRRAAKLGRSGARSVDFCAEEEIAGYGFGDSLAISGAHLFRSLRGCRNSANFGALRKRRRGLLRENTTAPLIRFSL